MQRQLRLYIVLNSIISTVYSLQLEDLSDRELLGALEQGIASQEKKAPPIKRRSFRLLHRRLRQERKEDSVCCHASTSQRAREMIEVSSKACRRKIKKRNKRDSNSKHRPKIFRPVRAKVPQITFTDLKGKQIKDQDMSIFNVIDKESIYNTVDKEKFYQDNEYLFKNEIEIKLKYTSDTEDELDIEIC